MTETRAVQLARDPRTAPIADRFCAGDTIAALVADFPGETTASVLNRIRAHTAILRGQHDRLNDMLEHVLVCAKRTGCTREMHTEAVRQIQWWRERSADR